jgi:hypothetical protein
MKEKLTILIVGGYGTFGGRLVELLEDGPRLTLIIAGRSLEKAKAYCMERGKTAAKLIPACFNRAGNLPSQLAGAGPDIVVDASGPFQTYGADQYKLIEACIAGGIHYLDLADGSDFVAGVRAFNEMAHAAGVFVLSGVSSFPVLTACVVRELSKDMSKIEAIRGGIAPSPYAGVGENVIRAIAGYAGQPIRVKRMGEEGMAYPFTESVRYTIAPPGYVPLNNRLFSLVDVPDLRLLAENWPETKNIWMGAAPVPEILHGALNFFAWVVRLRLAPSLLPLAKLMHFVTNHVRWGEHRGGMFVEVEGRNADGLRAKKSWHLLAEGKDGPLIPCMAIEAIIQKILHGHVPALGARAALNDLVLADYDNLFAKRTVYTGFREDAPSDFVPLYKCIFGSAWSHLPLEIQAMHDRSCDAEAKGLAHVERGAGLIANMIASIMGFPGSGKEIPVKVEFSVKHARETWKRTFGKSSFKSFQYAGTGRWERLLVERFGPLAFAMAPVPRDGRLLLFIRHWSVFGIPLPLWLAPRSDSFEFVENGRFHFNVSIFYPFVGLIVHYRGWLERIK